MMSPEDEAAAIDSVVVSTLPSQHQHHIMTIEKHDDDVATVQSEDGTEPEDVEALSKTRSFGATNATFAFAVATALMAAAGAIIITAVILVSHANQPNHPVHHDVSRLETIRSVLLDNRVSSRQSLFDESTAQYRAMNWLSNSNEVPAKPRAKTTSSPGKAIINRYVMALVYFNNNGFNWKHQFHFLSRLHVCDWHSESNEPKGVFCDHHDNIIQLDLGSNQLTGPIPMELAKLSSLSRLVVHYNNLTGTIPSELGQLSKLSYLTAIFNKLHGTIPSEMGELSLLSEMYLGGNQLSGPIPTEFGWLSSLTTLDLGGNDLNGTISTELGRLSSLDQLGLTNNRLHSTIPVELGNLSSLVNLDLSYNGITGTVPSVLAELPKLASLILYGTNLTGNLTATFCNGPLSLKTFTADCQSHDVECSCCTYCL